MCAPLPPSRLARRVAGNGYFTIDFGGADAGRGVVIQPDQQIVVTGTANGNGNVLLARLNNSNGSYDTTFNGGSSPYCRADNLGGTDRGMKVALDHDNRIVVGDTTTGTGGHEYMPMRPKRPDLLRRYAHSR